MKQIALHGRTLCIGDMVRHFKNETNKNLYPYRILLFARSTADQQVCVVYQSMGADKTIWVRPAEEFLSEVDHEKYPNIKQKYRFEVIQEEKMMKKKTKRILIGILATLMLAGCSEKLMAETTTLLANYVFATGSTVSVPVENMFLPVSEQQMESGSRTYIITTYVYLPNKTLWVGYRSDFYTYYHDGASAGALTQVLDTDGRPMVYEGEISEELLQEFRKTN